MKTMIKTVEGLGIEYDENVVCDVCRCVSSVQFVVCDVCSFVQFIQSISWLRFSTK